MNSKQRKNIIAGAKGSDIFQTDREDVRPILKYIPKHWRLWENACGEGQIVRFLEQEGYEVIGTDLLGGFNFLAPLACKDVEYDMIITNPPFSVKDEWLERCADTGKPFALFLPITFFDSIPRRRIFKEKGMQMLLPNSRPTFTTPSGKRGGSWFYAAWFCYGLNLPDQITFAD